MKNLKPKILVRIVEGMVYLTTYAFSVHDGPIRINFQYNPELGDFSKELHGFILAARGYVSIMGYSEWPEDTCEVCGKGLSAIEDDCEHPKNGYCALSLHKSKQYKKHIK